MKCHLYVKVAIMLLCIAVASVGITVFTAAPVTVTPHADKEPVTVVTSFYPVYIAALNVVGDTDGVEVLNMVENQAGCLHDYQMSPADRVTLQKADVFVMNGAGAEAFLDDVLAQMPELCVVDLSRGQTLLESGHVHEHDHEHSHELSEDTAHSVNSHLWVSPLRYRQQIETLRDGLIAADSAHAAQYTANAALYLEKIEAVWARLQQAAQPHLTMPTVLFHDSLAYLAEDLDLSVVAALNIGEDSAVETDDLAAAEDALRGVETALFLMDAQYETTVQLEDRVSHPVTLAVDTVVKGDGEADSWLKAMTALSESLEVAV